MIPAGPRFGEGRVGGSAWSVWGVLAPRGAGAVAAVCGALLREEGNLSIFFLLWLLPSVPYLKKSLPTLSL